ncbi:hypothetical protein LZ30DRAFT_302235 [Colletotrichum cereale]|nr:hypothetical protein LZ30DRAFT_302235 [Colletotrichum cereale]
MTMHKETPGPRLDAGRSIREETARTVLWRRLGGAKARGGRSRRREPVGDDSICRMLCWAWRGCFDVSGCRMPNIRVEAGPVCAPKGNPLLVGQRDSEVRGVRSKKGRRRMKGIPVLLWSVLSEIRVSWRRCYPWSSREGQLAALGKKRPTSQATWVRGGQRSQVGWTGVRGLVKIDAGRRDGEGTGWNCWRQRTWW